MMIGVDVGTTNSCAAFWDGRVPRMIELDANGAILMPSVVTIAQGEVYVGEEAIEKGRLFPDYDFRHFKRRMAERWHPDEDTGHQTCEGRDENGQPNGMTHYAGPDGYTYGPVELTSWVIAELVRRANAFLAPEEVTGAVVTVPADFTPPQVAAVEQAARMAGLEKVVTMKEPTAAALAHGFDAKKPRRIAVGDLGGGTFDISIVSTGGGLVDVIATNGIRDLGGIDWDKRLGEFVVGLWRTDNETDLATRDAAMVRVMVEAEDVKKRLSSHPQTTFRLDDIGKSGNVDIHMIYEIKQSEFDEMTQDLRVQLIDACKACVADVRRDDPNFSVRDLSDVLLVGGMTRVPSVRQVLQEFFGKPPKKGESPEQVVAMGAAIRAAIIEGRKPDITIADLVVHPIAIESVDNVPAILVPKGTSYPFEQSFMLSNPDEGQEELSIRLLYADRTKATDCERIWAAEVPIEGGPAKSARVPLTLRMDQEGRLSAEVADQHYPAAA